MLGVQPVFPKLSPVPGPVSLSGVIIGPEKEGRKPSQSFQLNCAESYPFGGASEAVAQFEKFLHTDRQVPRPAAKSVDDTNWTTKRERIRNGNPHHPLRDDLGPTSSLGT